MIGLVENGKRVHLNTAKTDGWKSLCPSNKAELSTSPAYVPPGISVRNEKRDVYALYMLSQVTCLR